MKKKWRIIAGAFTAAVCLAAGAQGVYADEQNVISDGVFIGDKDVSGMTADEAEAYVEGEVEKLEIP